MTGYFARSVIVILEHTEEGPRGSSETEEGGGINEGGVGGFGGGGGGSGGGRGGGLFDDIDDGGAGGAGDRCAGISAGVMALTLEIQCWHGWVLNLWLLW